MNFLRKLLNKYKADRSLEPTNEVEIKPDDLPQPLTPEQTKLVKLTVTIPTWQKEMIKSLAEADGTTMSAIVEQIFHKYRFAVAAELPKSFKNGLGIKHGGQYIIDARKNEKSFVHKRMQKDNEITKKEQEEWDKRKVDPASRGKK